LKVNANARIESAFLFDLFSAYICAANARGAKYHFPTGGKAQLRRRPDKAESKRFTNPMH
jgi:hypothetical protein